MSGAPDFRAIFIGDGEQSAAMKTFISEHKLDLIVSWIGPQTNNIVAEILSASDILVLPSAYEGIALAVYEAMASGLAVLATDVGGQSELVTPECGELIKPRGDENDVRSFVDVLGNWIRNPDAIKQMGAAGRRRIVENFDVSSLGPNIENAFNIAIANARKRKNKTNARALAQAKNFGLHRSERYWSHIWRMNWPATAPPKLKWMSWLWLAYWSSTASIKSSIGEYKLWARRTRARLRSRKRT
jgi:hypothetical protein